MHKIRGSNRFFCSDYILRGALDSTGPRPPICKVLPHRCGKFEKKKILGLWTHQASSDKDPVCWFNAFQKDTETKSVGSSYTASTKAIVPVSDYWAHFSVTVERFIEKISEMSSTRETTYNSCPKKNQLCSNQTLKYWDMRQVHIAFQVYKAVVFFFSKSSFYFNK